MSEFEKVTEHRIHDRVPIKYLREYGITEFYIGGNSLNRMPPNDIDIFPSTKDEFANVSDLGILLSSTKNATTVKIIQEDRSPIILQLCNYYHPSLKELVDSFDFSHIQIGAHVKNSSVVDTYYTNAYMESKMSESTEYVGSEYPLASLMRSYKYNKRNNFAGNSHIISAINIVHDVVERGFKGYSDFKDQLDAVDLGLVPEELESMEFGKAMALYNLLNKGKEGVNF